MPPQKRYTTLAISGVLLIIALIFWAVMAAYGQFFPALESMLSPVSGCIVIVLFQLIGFVSLWVNKWIVMRYLHKPFSKWWFVMVYALLLCSFVLFNYMALIVGRFFLAPELLFALPYRGFYVLFPLWLTEIGLMSMVLLVRAGMLIFHYKRQLGMAQMENADARYAALQSQVNPHFLFNSFNALVSEIETNPRQASVFARSLAQIYRYILDKQTVTSSTLDDELLFADRYIYVQQIRFADGVDYTVDVSRHDRAAYSLPPLSMQLLLENVFKHNLATEEHPIEIHVGIDGNRLVVKNNRRPRRNVDSTGKGLVNLNSRVELLTGEEIEVNETENTFTVKIPLVL